MVRSGCIYSNNIIDKVMFLVIVFFSGLILLCVIINNPSKENVIKIENESEEIINTDVLIIKHNDFVLLQKAQEETTEKVFVFQPYTFWYDYNRNTGEAIQINTQPLSTELQEYIYSLCKEHNLSFPLIMAQIGAETDFRTNLKSDVGAIGLMQIRDSIHYELMDYLGVDDLYNPYQNVKVGINLMHLYFDEYEDTNLALMVYNCGLSGAKRLWNKGIYNTSYTREILTVSQKYEEEFGCQ